MSRLVTIPELPGRGRLGRHIEHDPKSRAFEATTRLSPIRSHQWERHVPPFDQGELGSCTGNAMAGCLATGPHYKADRKVDESLAVEIYSHATRLDYIRGHYPPEDTGSSGLAVAKAASRMGLVHAYHHAFSLHGTLAALSLVGPVILGTAWYAAFDEPVGPQAELRIGGEVRGGHEVQLLGVDVEAKTIRGCNSWGDGENAQFGPKGESAVSQLVPTVRTTPTLREFATALLAVWPEATKGGAGVLWAQYASETGDGLHCYGWNLANVKWTKGCGLDYQALHGVWEIINGQRVEIPPDNPGSWFRVYPSLEEGMASFVDSKRRGQWRSTWPFVEAVDPDGYARELRRMFYYTAPVETYVASMKAKLAKWMASDAFDSALLALGEVPPDAETQPIIHVLHYDEVPDTEPAPPGDDAA